MSSAAIAAGDFPNEGGIWLRMKRKIARGLRRIAHDTSLFFKALGSGIVRGAKSLGRGTSRVGGAVLVGAGDGTAMVLSAAVFLLGASLVVVALVVATVAGLVAGIVRRTANMIRTYVGGFGHWLWQGRPMPWKQFKAERSLERQLQGEEFATRVSDWLDERFPMDETLRESDIVVEEPKVERFIRVKDDLVPLEIDDDVKTLKFHFDGEGWEVPVDDINVTYTEEGYQFTEEGLREQRALDDRAQTAAAEAYEKPELILPGTTPFLGVIDALDPEAKETDDPFTADGTLIVPHFDVMNSMNRAYEQDDIAYIDFDFSDFLKTKRQKKEAQFAFEWLSNEATNVKERSYWKGRQELLHYWGRVDYSKAMINEHGRLWALINVKYKGRQSRYSIKHMRAGFMDLLRELNEAHAKV